MNRHEIEIEDLSQGGRRGANLTLQRIERIHFSQTSVIYFCWGFRCSKHMSSRAKDCTRTKGRVLT